MHGSKLTLLEGEGLFKKVSKCPQQSEELTNQSMPCCLKHTHQMTLATGSPEEILAALVNSPFSMQVIRVLLSSTVLRRAAAGRPLPLLGTMTVLNETRGKLGKENVQKHLSSL